MSNRPLILPLAAALTLVTGCKSDNVDTGVSNTAPEANAGLDQTVPADTTVALSGSASFDQDGDALSYSWSFDFIPEGSALDATSFGLNDSAEAMETSFAPDAVGTFIVNLVVNDGKTDSVVDHVIIKAEEPSTFPTAVAGDDSTGEVSTPISLDGSGSTDPAGRELTYLWTAVQVPADSAITEPTDATSAVASFTPDARGVYIFNLVVNNGIVSSSPDALIVTVTGDDNAPVANAGADFTGDDCSSIQLDGSGSVDPDGDTLQYYWELQSKPSGSSATNDNFSDRTAMSPTFWADWDGEYVLSLTVSDGASWSLADMMTLDLSNRSVNTPPIVSISTLATISGGEVECEEDGYVYDCEDCGDQTIEIGPNVSINDPDSDPYTVSWELTSGSGIISNPSAVTTSVKLENIEATEPNVCDSNEWVLELTVTDCTTASTTESTTVTVDCCGIEASGS
ncbi:MAG: PKD domain-containing protein [Myxococcota bacterium]|nr:PKD domain-containing protein [Myxococcota bacterium]